MKKKGAFIAVGLSFITLMMACLYNPEPLSAMECQIIRINPLEGKPQSLKIEPETLAVSKGDCVVWFNASRELIKVTFKDGEKCSTIFQSPSGFSMDKECFTTSWLPIGSTGSVRLMENGIYDYTIGIKQDPTVQVKGTIEVK